MALHRRAGDAAAGRGGRLLSAGPADPSDPEATTPDPALPEAAVPDEEGLTKAGHHLTELERQGVDFLVVDTPPGWLRPLLAYQRAVDAVSEKVGALSTYLVIAVVGIGFVNAVLRYIGKFSGTRLTSNRYLELQWYLFATLFLLAFSYILKNGINVRVDFWYADLPEKRRAAIDLVGHLIALIPFCLLAISVLWRPILTSWGARPDGSFTTWQVWEVWERSPDPGGLPRAPIKSMLLVGFVLLLAQALAEVVKLVAVLRGHAQMRLARPAVADRVE